MSTSWYEFPFFLSACYVIERENLLVTWKCKQLLWWWMRSSTCTSYGGGNVVMTAAVSSVFSWNLIFMETIDKVRNLRLLFNFLSVYIRDNPDCNLGVKFKVRFRWILYSQIVTTLLFRSFELEFVSFWNFENARCNYTPQFPMTFRWNCVTSHHYLSRILENETFSFYVLKKQRHIFVDFSISTG
jgi:hypothetical protein